MALIIFKTKDRYVAENRSSRNADVLEYFVPGEGWKKTKKFTKVETDLPEDRWTQMSWLKLVMIFNEYGIDVADYYARHKTVADSSRRKVRNYAAVYACIEDLIPVDFNEVFFECLKCDGMLSVFGLDVFDIVQTDKSMSEQDPDYNDVLATYKGEQVSMRQYVLLKYGDVYAQIIDRLSEVIDLKKKVATRKVDTPLFA